MTEEIVFCKGGGCTAKLGPDLLSHVLGKIPRGEKDPDLLIGYDSRMMRLFIRLRKIPPLSRRWIFSADAGRSVFVWADCSGKCFK